MNRLALVLACAAIAGCTTLAPGYADLTLENLFNAERAFASDAYVRGVRPSFLAHFAADAIVFQPGPVKYVEFVNSHPGPADPLAVLVEWGPQAGAASRAGDLGFTTGPSRVSKRADPNAPASYGYYFSVWSRTDGAWKVRVDAGVSQVQAPPQEGVPNMRTPIFHNTAPPLTDTQRAERRDALFALERRPRAFGDAPGGELAWRDLVTPATRLLRNDEPALVGDALSRYLSARPAGRVTWTPLDGAIAASDDLAYTYGTSRESIGTAAPVDGYYVHVWQRDASGDWKLIAAVSLPSG
jgi:ketosteroid isomerase-like protein